MIFRKTTEGDQNISRSVDRVSGLKILEWGVMRTAYSEIASSSASYYKKWMMRTPRNDLRRACSILR